MCVRQKNIDSLSNGMDAVNIRKRMCQDGEEIHRQQQPAAEADPKNPTNKKIETNKNNVRMWNVSGMKLNLIWYIDLVRFET